MTMRNIQTLRLLGTALVLGLAVGCQQKMAEQPAPRPYEQHNQFANKQSARPLERGVIHRNQPTSDDPLVNWLTPLGKNPQVSAEWKADAALGTDPSKATNPTAGAPTDPANFVNEFPFALTVDDLKRGQSLYNANCALCHGAGGYGNGKIVERGFLKPPSYHTDPKGTDVDAGHFFGEAKKDLPLGYSRGFDRYGRKIALKDVPVGYIYQVITWGYGGMASHETQLPNPVDRWRVIGYLRALQLSQNIEEAKIPADMLKKIKSGESGAEKKAPNKEAH
jgi:Cytochrome C oxidase, cbb3-type, subunit III